MRYSLLCDKISILEINTGLLQVLFQSSKLKMICSEHILVMCTSLKDVLEHYVRHFVHPTLHKTICLNPVLNILATYTSENMLWFGKVILMEGFMNKESWCDLPRWQEKEYKEFDKIDTFNHFEILNPLLWTFVKSFKYLKSLFTKIYNAE